MSLFLKVEKFEFATIHSKTFVGKGDKFIEIDGLSCKSNDQVIPSLTSKNQFFYTLAEFGFVMKILIVSNSPAVQSAKNTKVLETEQNTANPLLEELAFAKTLGLKTGIIDSSGVNPSSPDMVITESFRDMFTVLANRKVITLVP